MRRAGAIKGPGFTARGWFLTACEADPRDPPSTNQADIGARPLDYGAGRLGAAVSVSRLTPSLRAAGAPNHCDTFFSGKAPGLLGKTLETSKASPRSGMTGFGLS